MNQLSLEDQYNLIGGTSIKAMIMYTFFKTSLYKIMKSSGGKIFIPKIISAQWKS